MKCMVGYVKNVHGKKKMTIYFWEQDGKKSREDYPIVKDRSSPSRLILFFDYPTLSVQNLLYLWYALGELDVATAVGVAVFT
jgi:hypothetical protein